METQNHEANGASRPRRKIAGLLAATCALGLLSFAEPIQNEVGEQVEMARATLEKWVETRRIISQEKRDWAVGRELLQERIDLVKREIESLQGRLDEAESSIADADQKRAELVEENDSLKQASASLGGTVADLESRTKALMERVPDPVIDRIKALLQRIPANPDETKASLSERFQNVVGVLDQTNRFHREITVTPELRELEDGKSAEVTTFYLGIGKAYYASNDGTAAGVGTSTAEGWGWSAQNDAAEAISHAIAILNGGKVAEFVRIPLQVD